MISAVRALLQKHREIVCYVFWGVMTTLVNYAAYLLLTGGLHIHYLAGNAAAWAVSVLFAYFVNKLFVFESKSWAWRVALRELWQMAVSRLFTLGLELGILWFFVDLLHFGSAAVRLPAGVVLHGDAIVKLAANVVVVVVNYVLSKFIIFKRKPI